MRSLLSARSSSVGLAAVAAMALVIASTTTVAGGKKPPKPPPTPAPTAEPQNPPSVTIAVAATATLEPNRQYANLDVTVTCPTGWTWVRGITWLRQSTPGGSGSFTASCTGTPQLAHSRIVNGNKWTLGDATATAYVTLSRNGQEVSNESTRTVRLNPLVTVRVADQGQLTGTSGGGARLAVAVACPGGSTGQSSTLTVTQGATTGSGSFTPVCDGTSRTFVVSVTASGGTFQTGGATGAATASVGFSGGSFTGSDSRGIPILQSSTGDTTPPSTPAGMSASIFGDGETWLSWAASTDNATPSGLITYEVYLNGRFDQGVGGGYTQAILYADLGVMNQIDVIAVDGAGNKSAPTSVFVDCTAGFGCAST